MTLSVLQRYAAAFTILVLGTVVSSLIFSWARQAEVQRFTSEFNSQAGDRVEALRRACQDQVDAVEEVRDLFAASKNVERGEFRDFTLPALRRHDCMRALAWCPRVAHADRDMLVAVARREGIEQFSIVDRAASGWAIAPPRQEYFPVVYLQSSAPGHPLSHGLDLAGIEDWRLRIARLRDHGTPAVLGKVVVPGARGDQTGLVIAQPLYRGDLPAGTATERRTAFTGVVVGITALDDLVDQTLGALAQEKILLSLGDVEGPLGEQPLFTTGFATGGESDADLPELTVDLPFADRRLRVKCRPTEAHLATFRSWMAYGLLIGGLFTTLLASGVLAAVGWRSARTERLIVERTSELKVKVTEHLRSEAALSVALNENAILAAAVANTTAGVVITDPNQTDNPVIFINRAFTVNTGYSSAEVIGRNCRFLQGEKTDRAAVRLIGDAVRACKPARVELLNYRRNGTTFWSDLSVTPVQDNHGRLIYFVGIQADVSEQKYASLALQRERDRLQRQLVFANAFAAAAEVVVAEEDNRDLLGGLVACVGAALGVDRVHIFDVDLDRHLGIGLTEWINPEAKGVDSTLDVYPLELFSRTIARLWDKRGWIESHDDTINPLLTEDGAAALLHGRMANRSILAYPFQFRANGFYLVMLNQVRFRRTWKEDEIQFLESVSKLTSVALEKIRLIAQRRMTEEAIRASEMRYRAIVEDQSELICRFRSDATVTFVNEAYCRYFGKTRADIEGHSFMPLIPGDDRELVQRQFAALSPTSNLASYSHRVSPPGRGERWMQWTVRAFFDQVGQALEFQAVGQDVTERKQAEDNLRASEASFRSLVEQAPEGILIANTDGIYVEVNPVTCALVGYSRDELLHMTIRDLLSEEEHPLLGERLRLYREGHTLFGERVMRRKDGSRVTVEMIAKQLPDRRILAIIRDISERLRNERSLREAKEAAERASLAKSAFLANMSHEIRTPMNGILGMIGLMLETPLDAEVREFAETAHSSGEHLLTIINDILDFSKIEADRLELESIVFELPALLEETVALFAEQAQAKGLELVCFVHPDAPQSVRGDPARLRQVLINLIGNAVKFTAAGEVVVKIGVDGDQVGGSTGKFRVLPESRLPGMGAGPDVRELPTAATPSDDSFEPHDEEVMKLRITVTDTGAGIPEEAHQRLFQAFSQVDSSTTRRYGGTGLGLAISRRLVELMGGNIGFSSSSTGTTFYFSVELAVPALPPEPPLIPDELRDLRVLVADDHPLVRELLCLRLTSWGMRAEPVTDASQALSALRDAHYAGPPFAIAIIDLDMPGTDGLSLIRAIRSDPDLAGIQLIALTSLAHRGPSQEAKKLGARVCLTKPIQSVKLLDALLVVTGRREANEPETRSMVAPLRDGARVLVAEDNLVNRRLALAQLAQFGLQADAVTNGREALAALEKVRYDLVLMDGQMPELDGYGATAELRRREAGTSKHMVVIAMTADALVGDRERCLAAGMDDYLAKPVKVPDLRAMLAKWLKLKPLPKPVAPPTPTQDASGRWSKSNDPKTSRHEAGDASTSHYRRVVKEGEGLDPTVIEDLLSQGGRDLLGQLTEALRQEGPVLLARIGEAMGRGDVEAANAAVHRLKGSAWSLGMRELASACLALEHALGVGMADVERLRQAVVSDYDSGLVVLDRIVKNTRG